MDDKELLQKVTEAIIDLNRRVDALEKKAATPESESDVAAEKKSCISGITITLGGDTDLQQSE